MTPIDWRAARPVLKLSVTQSGGLPNSLQSVPSLPLPSRVPDILYHRRLQVPCLKSQHIALPFFYLLPFPILSQLCPEFLYFSIYSCHAWQSIMPKISSLADMEQGSSLALRTLLVNQGRESKLFRGEQGKHLVMGLQVMIFYRKENKLLEPPPKCYYV